MRVRSSIWPRDPPLCLVAIGRSIVRSIGRSIDRAFGRSATPIEDGVVRRCRLFDVARARPQRAAPRAGWRSNASRRRNTYARAHIYLDVCARARARGRGRGRRARVDQRAAWLSSRIDRGWRVRGGFDFAWVISRVRGCLTVCLTRVTCGEEHVCALRAVWVWAYASRGVRGGEFSRA